MVRAATSGDRDRADDDTSARPADHAPARKADAWLLTDVVTQLRRVLRSSIRTDYPWESLPMAQVELLQRLADEPGLRINDLAQRHRLANNTVSTLVQQLVTAGLVRREPSAADRRAVTVSLTEQGTELIAGWRSAHERRIADALDQLSEADRASVLGALPALSKLVSRLRQADVSAGGVEAADTSTAAQPRRPARRASPR